MSDTENNKYDGVSITLKHGKGYDDSWTVFHGTVESVKDQIEAYFGWDKGAYDTLAEAVVEATALVHGAANVAKGAGGRPIPSGEKSEDKGEPASTPEPEKKDSPLLERVESSTSRTELKKLWAANREAFDGDKELMAAYAAKGKSLPKE